MSRLTLAQISDCHILPDRKGRLREMEPLPRLEQVVARVARRIAERGDVDLVVFTGDQIQDDPTAYPVFLEAIAPITAPVVFVPGNHDHRDGFAEHLLPRMDAAIAAVGPGSGMKTTGGDMPPLFRSFRLGHARIVLLDSLWDGRVQGRIGDAQLRWLDDGLREMVPGPTLTFVHHSPHLTGVEWLDPHRIEDSEALVWSLATHGARHVFFGHVHQPMTLEENGLLAVSAPATCFGFGGDGDAPVLLGGPPGLTWIDVEADRVRSRVEWIHP